MIQQYIMPPSAPEIALPLRHAITTCRILFGCTFEQIERKTDVKADSLFITIYNHIAVLD